MKAKETRIAVIGILSLLMLTVGAAWGIHNEPMMGVIDGVNGPVFTLTTGTAHISSPEGNSIFVWGFADASELSPTVQYPGPTMIVNQGDVVTVNLINTLLEPVSIVFPGQQNVMSIGGIAGSLTREADANGGIVSYSFTAAEPGTYMYHSGTNMDLQIEMGLVGALIVRPAGFDPMAPKAYEKAESAYDIEYLFLLTEIDPRIHRLVEYGLIDQVDTTKFFPTYWYINGRNAPDTMFEPFASWLPTQPYNCMPMMYPGQRMLMRIIGAGRDSHPFHHHGNHAQIIAKDGRLLDTGTGKPVIDLSYKLFTEHSVPGQTIDAIFTWTGEKLGWDVYGHAPGDPLAPNEYAPDHGKPFPVLLPENLDLAFGGFWAGSPFLGGMGALPPGEGGLNPMGGLTYMWHSHTEKEMCNNDIFPGGLMTMLIIVPPGMMMEAPPLVPGQNPIMGREGGR